MRIFCFLGELSYCLKKAKVQHLLPSQHVRREDSNE